MRIALTLATLVAFTSLAYGAVQPIYPQPGKPTRAAVDFCARFPSECAINTKEPRRITMTPEIMKTLQEVNASVNHRIQAVEDFAHWGVADHWDFAEDGRGDCEDYQLVKRRTLRDQYGLPQRAMRMTVVLDANGDGHAVLTILTDQGNFILDNLRDAVLSWDQTGYTFVSREGSNGEQWVSLRPAQQQQRVITTTPK